MDVDMETDIQQIALAQPFATKFPSTDHVHQLYRDPSIAALTIGAQGDYVRVSSDSKHGRAKEVNRYLEKVLNEMTPKDIRQGVVGIYAISYEDACSQPGVFAMNKRVGDPSVLLPDLYQMGGYNAFVRNLHDPHDFKSKVPKMFFAGASTGDSANLAKNERINACMWSEQNRDISQFGITNIVQTTKEAIQEYLARVHFAGTVNSLMYPTVQIPDQIRYKYLVSIDGNAAAFDRLVWIMKSNSLAIRLKSGFLTDANEYTCWYYPLMKPNIHYMQAENLDELRQIFNVCESRPDACIEVIKNAQAFVATYCLNMRAHMLYTATLFTREIS